MQKLDHYIDQVRDLPPAPKVLSELLSLLSHDDIDAGRVVKLISLEPALTASVLRLCNSAYFAAATAVADLQEAVTRLGFRQIYQVVAATIGSRTLSPPQKGYGLDQGELWKHSVTAAIAAQLLARRDDENEHMVFTAALLHDIGKIVLADALAGQYGQLLEQVQKEQHALIEAEKRLLGVEHAEIGGRLLARWNFPPDVVNAVWFHHHPASAPHRPKLAAYVYLGNMVAYFMGHGYGHQAFALRGRTEALQLAGVEASLLPHLMIETFDQMRLVEALFHPQ